jgi:hypothetical protein
MAQKQIAPTTQIIRIPIRSEIMQPSPYFIAAEPTLSFKLT